MNSSDLFPDMLHISEDAGVIKALITLRWLHKTKFHIKRSKQIYVLFCAVYDDTHLLKTREKLHYLKDVKVSR